MSNPNELDKCCRADAVTSEWQRFSESERDEFSGAHRAINHNIHTLLPTSYSLTSRPWQKHVLKRTAPFGFYAEGDCSRCDRIRTWRLMLLLDGTFHITFEKGTVWMRHRFTFPNNHQLTEVILVYYFNTPPCPHCGGTASVFSSVHHSLFLNPCCPTFLAQSMKGGLVWWGGLLNTD